MDTWNKFKITPIKFEEDIIKLAKQIPKNKYKYIVSIPRGGCVIGVYLSHLCNLDYLDPIQLLDYHHSETDLSKILIVDDLVDTGVTLQKLQKIMMLPDSAVLYYKPRSVIVPTYYTETVSNTDWIVFPWELTNEEPNREI
jgi:hypoxanthine phosphoribosyltransferase